MWDTIASEEVDYEYDSQAGEQERDEDMSTIEVNSTTWYTNSSTTPPQPPAATALASPFITSIGGVSPPTDGVDATLARTQHIITEGAKANIPVTILEMAANEGHTWGHTQVSFHLALVAEQVYNSTGQAPDLTQSPLARKMANALAEFRRAADNMVAPGVAPDQF